MTDTPEKGPGIGDALRDEMTGRGVDWRTLVLVPALAVFSALVIGGVIILATGSSVGNVLDAFGALGRGSVGSLRALSETFTAAAPLILAGLAVGIGFQAGLFNIGGEGQIVVGGLSAVAVGVSFEGLWAPLHVVLALGGGVLAGAIWGGFPGWLRAQTGAHEVITTIMLNAIAIRLADFLLKTTFFQKEGSANPVSKDVLESARLPRLLTFIDPRLRIHLGIFVALAAAWFAYWLLFKTSIGFEFRAVGANPHAAEYAGVKVKRTYFLVMAVAGAMAGLGGANQVLGVLGRATPGFSANIGFDAIAMALLGRSHPFGIVAAGILFGGLRAGGQQMQVSADVGIDIISVIQALIIVFIAAPALIRAIYRVKAGGESQQITQGWAT